MKYLKHFNKQLKSMRDKQSLSIETVAEYCMVDSTLVNLWEADDVSKRCYPSLDNLLDLCFKTNMSLETFIDLPDKSDDHQLDLPGISVENALDINDSLNELDKAIEKLVPTEDEKELLRKFRRSDKQSKELILQLIA